MRIHHILLLGVLMSGCSSTKENLSPKDGKYFTNPFSSSDVKGSSKVQKFTPGEYKYRYGSVLVNLKTSHITKYELRESWNNDIRISSEPAFVDDGMVTMNDQGHIAKFNSNGKLVWKTKFSPRKTFCSNIAISANDKIAVASCGTNFVKAFDLAKGKELWLTELDDAIASKPLFVDDKVILVSKNDSIYSLKSDTGKLDWFIPGMSRNNRTIAAIDLLLVDNHVIQQTSDDQVRAIDIKNGHVDASISVASTMNFVKSKESSLTQSSIALDPKNKDIYLTNSDGYVVKVNRNFKLEWTSDVMSQGSLWILDNIVIGVSRTGVIFSLSKHDGKTVWTNDLPSKLIKSNKPEISDVAYNKTSFSDPIVINGVITVFASDNRIITISPEDGSIINSKKLNDSVFGKAFVQNKNLFVLTNNGNKLLEF